MNFQNNSKPGALSPDDPRISAYAFGELEGEELAAVEAAVAADPELAARVAELIEFGGELGSALDAEEAPAGDATEVAQAAIIAPGFSPVEQRRTWRFAGWAVATGGLLAAACLALVLLLREGPPAEPTDTRRSADGSSAPLPEARVEASPEPLPPLAVDSGAGANPSPMPPPSPPIIVEPPEAMAVAHADAPQEQRGAPDVPPAETPDAETPAPRTKSEALVWTPPTTDGKTAPPSPATNRPSLPKTTNPLVIDPRAPQLASAGGDGAATVRTMLNEGRSQYAAGNLDAAAALFAMVKTRDAGNREATYFTSRIARDRTRTTVSTTRVDPSTTTVTSRPAAETTSLANLHSRTVAAQGARLASSALPPIEFVAARSPSTFAIDVDTGSYPLMRQELLRGLRTGLRYLPTMPIEELVNYFPYHYEPPAANAQGEIEPFAVHLSAAAAPWNPDNRLVRVAIKGREVPSDVRPPANLVFVVDVSGSMGGVIRLVKASLSELLDRLRPDDRVAIVTFDGKARVSLASTPVSDRELILAGIEGLRPRGGTNGGAGIGLAYEIARENFQAEGINRVVLCSDGMFNVGVTDRDALLALIRKNALGRVYLTVLGYGNLPLRFMGRNGPLPSSIEVFQLLANNGNGVFGFVDSPREALKILGEEVDGTLAAIAKDVKLQVAFDRSIVESYRLLGYQERALSGREFEQEGTDGGEIGAGHTVTALYEVVPVSKQKLRRAALAVARGEKTPDMLTLEIRYKLPESEENKVMTRGVIDVGRDFEDADPDFKFAAAVAAWGMLLREGERSRFCTIDDVLDWAKEGMAGDEEGYRAEFLEVAERSAKLFKAARSQTYP